MVEKDLIIKESVKFAGIGDFKASYNHAHDWLKDEGYGITEDNYTEKIKGDGKDADIVWTATKKLTDYFRVRLDVKWRILGMSDVEVEINGSRKKMNKLAELKIDIKGTLERDYNSKWSGSPIQKFLKDTYHKYIIPARIDEKRGQVKETVQEFKDEMKAFFDLTCKR